MNLLYLTILFPLLGFLLLAFSRGRWSENTSATVGVGSIGLAALVAAWVVVDFMGQQHTGGVTFFNQHLWTWMTVGNFDISVTLMLDGLSVTMLSVVIGVGFFIHLFASWYMRGEEGYSRFFAYTNLFIASMVVLVLADNLLLMYLGWEGVGLCSYLLIGFYYTNPKNGAAAMKAFIVTRVGDVFLAFALFILYKELGTLNFRELMVLAPQKLAEGSPEITWATLMLLGGAVGKSAQLPLQTWLADAMAGPTPVSALIHAATMVTAGVYLIARTNGLFLMAPDVLHLVGIVGAVTLVLAGFAALVQTDIKRVLAYSTMSQIGYMFLALGVQAWDAAIFHLMTHAFFKALLFLSSGSVILACHHEQNIFKMGGLRKTIPLVYVCFLVGGAALSALPLVTAGFFSKDEILAGAWANGHINLMVAGLAGAFMTSLYTFRMIFIVFHGEEKIKAHAGKGISHHLPLVVLMILSTFIGAMIVPPLHGVLPATTELEHGQLMTLEITSGVVAIAGILLAALLWLGKRQVVNSIAKSAPGRFFSTWWFHAWGFDWLYDHVFVKPYLAIAKLLQRDPLNALMTLPATVIRWGNSGLALSANGQLRWYVASMGFGAVLVLGLLLLV
ncbi:NADH-quinone oxidoreductase chain L [Pectobacterium atrosepticum SCRI1043]|uniref:NADH-quinone oxidoreductase subunit L n=1 Tax=Pectobacterium atrosepticum (strain SCRI 1043 / ATCC BAA-672) TaxID=218491 RepID=Q6D2S7_PECAS|nr:NADH-quinone oxidoreductase subunit L [Pectobacterium atrosepticum]AIA71844.1 NADH:ubiquinone oxidoreductase subunit L [Pectobacterium atrosepticum]AIK14806.1 NADH-quinone oxidoreductase chain L [Pectobacterium atrosepticum]MCL6315007.1 NADH-quinone oxidoreductase subunit L [Pectobacterium atrosepticum]MCL6320757.1 NADH-quinone oxidoreductase subunit L [Pectobacterium atrosepticum]POW31397.1 NADH-quinone oxidoreductase subunit L [Pectobacterium atrosepticum]